MNVTKSAMKVAGKIGIAVYKYNFFWSCYTRGIKKVMNEESFKNYFKIIHFKNTKFKQYLDDIVIKHHFYVNDSLIIEIDSALGNQKFDFNEFLHQWLEDFKNIFSLVTDESVDFKNRDDTLKRFVGNLALPSQYMRYLYE